MFCAADAVHSCLTSFTKVIQKLLERVSPDRLAFINTFMGHVYELSTHPYGCRVLQRCFEHLPEEQTRPLLDELHKYTLNLMQDQFGVRYLCLCARRLTDLLPPIRTT